VLLAGAPRKGYCLLSSKRDGSGTGRCVGRDAGERKQKRKERVQTSVLKVGKDRVEESKEWMRALSVAGWGLCLLVTIPINAIAISKFNTTETISTKLFTDI